MSEIIDVTPEPTNKGPIIPEIMPETHILPQGSAYQTNEEVAPPPEPDLFFSPVIEPEKPIVTYDKESEHSFIDSLSPAFQNIFNALEEKHPDLLELSSDELEEKLHPTIIHRQLKVSFWNEYERAKNRGKPVTMGQVSRGVTSENYLSHLKSSNLKIFAYIFATPVSYSVMAKETLEMGIRNLRNIVTANVCFEDGTLNPRSAEAVIKAVALLDLRVKGATVMRVEQKSINVNQNQNTNTNQNINIQIEAPAPKTAQSLSEIELQIEEAKQRMVELAQNNPTMSSVLQGVHKSIDYTIKPRVGKSFESLVKSPSYVPNEDKPLDRKLKREAKKNG